jgi:transcription termination factor NusB
MSSLEAAVALNQAIPESLNNLFENAHYAGKVLEFVTNAYSTDPRNANKPAQEYVQGAVEALADHVHNVATQISACLDLQSTVLDDTLKNVARIDSVSCQRVISCLF